MGAPRCVWQEADLQQLGMPMVDLLLLHWTCDTLEETIEAYKAMQPLVASGKARAIGISNFNASMIDALLAAPGVTVKPAVNQCGFSIGGHSTSALGRDLETLKKCKETGARPDVENTSHSKRSAALSPRPLQLSFGYGMKTLKVLCGLCLNHVRTRALCLPK